MQDQFVGDVGDFGKYGLLRHLCAGCGDGGPLLSLGVVWYWVPDEGGNDGRHLGYLKRIPKNLKAFRECDPPLYDALHKMLYGCCDPPLYDTLGMLSGCCYPVLSERRNVRAVQNAGILPHTIFYPSPVPANGESAERSTWAGAAVEQAKDCAVVFLDPDNGLEPESRLGRKHVFYKELKPYVETGQSLVVYHHLGRSRNRSHNEQIASVASKISSELGSAREVISLRYRRGTGRAYFIIPNGREVLFNQRIRSFLCGPWGQQKVRGRPHFQQVL